MIGNPVGRVVSVVGTVGIAVEGTDSAVGEEEGSPDMDDTAVDIVDIAVEGIAGKDSHGQPYNGVGTEV